jgi:hypothetical protein
MSWKSVDLGTPKEGEYLCLIKIWITTGADKQQGYGMAMTTPVDTVAACKFDPKRGWRGVLLNSIDFEVLFLMEMPDSPNDCISMNKLFPPQM